LFRNFLLILFCCFCVGFVSPADPTNPGTLYNTDGAFDCTGYDVCQNLENASGYDNSETWTENDGSTPVDPDYSSAPITDSYSLRLADTGTDSDTYTTFTAHGDGTTTYVYFRFKVLSNMNSVQNIVVISDGGLYCGSIRYSYTTGNIAVNHGSYSGWDNTDTSTGSVFHVWFDWTSSTDGTDGVANLYVSATGTKPGSPDATVNNGDADYPGVDRIQFIALNSIDWVVDRILVDNSAIGSQ
jgi:hypothetical protein